MRLPCLFYYFDSIDLEMLKWMRSTYSITSLFTTTSMSFRRKLLSGLLDSLCLYSGWFTEGAGGGSVGVGTIAIVWDREMAEIQQALRMTLDMNLLVLTDSKAALASIVQVGQQGMGQTRDLVEEVDRVGCRLALELAVRFG